MEQSLHPLLPDCIGTSFRGLGRLPIFYKEWLKTRWYCLAALAVTWGFTGYCLLRIGRVVRLMGAEHLWLVMLERDAIFIEPLMFVPLIAGALLALVQFAPEMLQSRLKLTLHLPCSHTRMVAAMLGYGLLVLAGCFASCFALMGVYLYGILPAELRAYVLLTALTWHVAGLAAYLLGAWVCLEPTWKRRAVNLLVSACLLRVFFLSTVPEAYNPFLPLLVVCTLSLAVLPQLSVWRFKAGKQDS